MTEYALRLESNKDNAPRVRMGDTLGMAPAGALQGRGGLRPDGGGAVSVVEGTMSTEVTPFLGWVDGEASVGQGGYPFVLDATKTLTHDDGDATGTRIDTIVAQVNETAFDNSGVTMARVHIIKGTPGAGTAPVLPDACEPLRDVIVPADASVGTGGLVQANAAADRRRYTAALGGVVHVTSAAERNQLAASVDICKRLDTGRLEFRDDGGWRTLYMDQREVQDGEEFIQGNGTAELVGYVNFPEPFSKAPRVMAVMGGGGAFMFCMVDDESTTRFRYRVRVNSNEAFTSGGQVNWQAEAF